MAMKKICPLFSRRLNFFPLKPTDIPIRPADLNADQPDLSPLSLIFFRIFFLLDLLKSTTGFRQFIDLKFKNIHPFIKTDGQVDTSVIGDILQFRDEQLAFHKHADKKSRGASLEPVRLAW